jgi:formylglycine-generating enzyme required for sulfatase activity
VVATLVVAAACHKPLTDRCFECSGPGDPFCGPGVACVAAPEGKQFKFWCECGGGSTDIHADAEIEVVADPSIEEPHADVGDDEAMNEIESEDADDVHYPDCVPSCGGKECGDDGCGGGCGTCDPWKSCESGRCVTKGTVCAGTTCPGVYGYDVVCNAQDHCEYVSKDNTGWRSHDVWVHVPAGSFTMGSPTGEGGHESHEEPQHDVTFAKGYLIGKYEVTVLQYEACLAASPTKCTTPSTADWDGAGWGVNYSLGSPAPKTDRPEHPQNGLTWSQARAVCAWTCFGCRLPYESEWEYAASGPVHRKYPWGDVPEPDCDHAVWDPDGDWQRPWGCDPCTTTGCSGTSPVGSKPLGASWSGALDMAGNVWEWVQDCWHSGYDGDGDGLVKTAGKDHPVDGTAWEGEGCTTGSNRVKRGGGFNTRDAAYLRSSGRDYDGPSVRYAGFGARCLRPLP